MGSSGQAASSPGWRVRKEGDCCCSTGCCPPVVSGGRLAAADWSWWWWCQGESPSTVSASSRPHCSISPSCTSSSTARKTVPCTHQQHHSHNSRPVPAARRRRSAPSSRRSGRLATLSCSPAGRVAAATAGTIGHAPSPYGPTAKATAAGHENQSALAFPLSSVAPVVACVMPPGSQRHARDCLAPTPTRLRCWRQKQRLPLFRLLLLLAPLLLATAQPG